MTDMKAGDSLKVVVDDNGKVSLEYDPNDPHWSWLGQATDEQIETFIQLAREDYDTSR
tara:strand:+ start:6831 stop:7004 length:174 start_codon:yes stop_codon:yes gene_type:complete